MGNSADKSQKPDYIAKYHATQRKKRRRLWLFVLLVPISFIALYFLSKLDLSLGMVMVIWGIVVGIPTAIGVRFLGDFMDRMEDHKNQEEEGSFAEKLFK